MTVERKAISTGWTFKKAGSPDSELLPVALFPTTIHLDLLHHGKICDPSLDANEAAVQWVGEEAWVYRVKFAGPKEKSAGTRVELVFEGLDTYASILLNAKEIQKTENMYIEYRVDVTDTIAEENELEILFESTFLIGRKLEKEAEQAGVPTLFCHNGDSSRLQVRKAPYSYGWDWGPTLLTCGPWRPVYLETYTGRISDLSFRVELPESLSRATVTAVAEIEGPGPDVVEFELFGPDGSVVGVKQIVAVAAGAGQATFEVTAPELWYPIGNGSQPLYTLKARGLRAGTGAEVCSSSKRLGIRRVQLIQRPLKNAPGTSFFFVINNVPIFCRGADWIPADMILPRVTAERYRAWVEFVANGNQNMIRVWGGGIYEDDVFYDACDELGVMVWQDFMLGCGSYPATDKFLKTIEEEVLYNLRRMRHHPSIVLWCGNNEDHMFADKYTPEYKIEDQDPANWAKTNWPARVIYDKILPAICAKHVPDTPYHPGSPWGGKLSNDTTVGDTHAWGVWMKASEQYPYQDYPKLAGRFVSEFGLKSYPPVRMIEQCITDPEERFPQSRTMDAHMKSSSKSTWARDNRTIALYLNDNVRHGFTLEQYVYASQLIQAEAMGYAFNGWRRLWKGPGNEECAGTLVWQLNDAWPSVSWSIGDYQLRPKYAYFSIKRAMAPLTVGVSRAVVETARDNEVTHVHIHKETRIQVWGSNFTVSDETLDLVLQGFDLTTGKCLWQEKKEVTLMENRSTEVYDEVLSAAAGQTIVSARLLERGKVIARFSDWPQPFRHYNIPKPEIKLIVKGDEVRVSAPVPVKGLVININDDDVKFEDNVIDLVPGDEQVIVAKGLNGRDVSCMHLGTAA